MTTELAEIYANLQLVHSKHHGCTTMIKLIEETFNKYAEEIET